ncbi:hypothetical protein DFH09DRAFT_1082488 [Mycena vulgaris]|nr:hypothetical protein DFH09DRAFT_1082488 [Mycena vulgaris]
MSRPCQAEDSDGEECDCETFAPKTGKPKVCPEHESTGMLSKMTQAKRESQDGMRPKSTKFKSTKDTKLAKKSKGPREPASVATFKIDAIVVLPDGVQQHERKLQLRADVVPSKAAIQLYVNQGLAVRKDNQIKIALSATHEDVVDLLSQHLPGPMAYFDQIGRSVFGDTISGGMVRAAPWVLLTWVKTKLEIVHVANPTGQDLYTHLWTKEHNGKPVHLHIATVLGAREAIPDEERLVWHTPDSLAFILPEESGESNDDIEAQSDSSQGAGRQKGSTRKRISSIAFESSDGDSLSGSEDKLARNKLAPKKRNVGVHNNYAEEDLPSIFTDAIAQELNPFKTTTRNSRTSRNAIAGPSTSRAERTCAPTINLTRTPSPEVPFFMLARTPTPESEYATFDDPSFSDPVEYEYLTGPRTQRKYF